MAILSGRCIYENPLLFKLLHHEQNKTLHSLRMVQEISVCKHKLTWNWLRCSQTPVFNVVKYQLMKRNNLNHETYRRRAMRRRGN